MAGSFSSLYVHLVFSTRNREPLLAPAHRQDIFAYMAAILRESGCEFVLVNGVADHVHVVCTLPVSVTLAELVAKLKGNSSHWIRKCREDMTDFRWQSGYAAFSFARKNLDAVRRYVNHQETHHRHKTFDQEYRELLTMASIEFEDRYLLG
jgi:REP element-mobilizing transposase RayT